MTSAPHRSHGWNNDSVVPTWPTLAADELRVLLHHFPAYRGPVQVLWNSPRPFSAAARVLTPGGEIFVKRHHHAVRSPNSLREEHRFIAHLQQHGLPVPQVLANTAGETALAQGNWCYEVHAPALGLDLYRDTASWTPVTEPGHAYAAGNMLARLHQAAADFIAPPRSTSLLVATDSMLHAPDLIAAIQAQCATRPALADFLHHRDWPHEIASLLPRHRRLQQALPPQPRLWTHGDWHASNLCWSSTGKTATVSSILDFGLCAPTFALFDLATSIERNAIAWLQQHDGTYAVFPETALQLIAGYAEVLPLPQAQRLLLAEVLPLVHLDFALSEVEYFHAITGNASDAELAWRDFLIGHTQWFDTAPGQHLLACIGAAG